MQKRVIIESFRNISRRKIERCLKRKINVIVLESFAGLHKNRGPTPGFPYPHPDYAQKLIEEGKVEFLSVDLLDEKTFYAYAADKAVEVVEAVYLEYKKKHSRLIQRVCQTLNDERAENGFKKALCQRLAVFYSQNILLHRISRHYGDGPLIVYPESNIVEYREMFALVEQSGQEVFRHPYVQFPLSRKLLGHLENFVKAVGIWGRLFFQTLGGFFLKKQQKFSDGKRSFLYAVTVMSPRQLRSNQRGPAFIVDEKKIFAKDVVCFPLFKISEEQNGCLQKLPVTVCPVPGKGECFSNGFQWLDLLGQAIAANLFFSYNEIHTASILYFQYFRWRELLKKVSFSHFITHVDFDVGHIGRNIALHQSGVKTWYFSDSMNLGCVYWGREDGCRMRHPYWAYLNYDHFVTWTGLLEQFYLAHPTQLKETHIVGCLWSQQVHSSVDSPQTDQLKKIKEKGKFVLAVFDTTYSLKGYATYAEGLVFTRDVLKLLEFYDDVHLVFKEKKDRGIHQKIDPVEASKLLEVYEQMKTHPGISLFSNQADSAALMAVADMVISFPFTSSTFEAISCGKPAIWHDPLGVYRDTVFGRQQGFVTHGFEQLKEVFAQIKGSAAKKFFLPTVTSFEAMDPYNDAKAIDRFRDLLFKAKADL